MSYRPEGLRTMDEADDAPPATSAPAGIGVRGWLRWAWRQLTSMRVALLLLMLLALAALPGAFFPQRPQDPAAVAAYYADNPGAAEWLERFGVFDVYGAPWFAAIYLLLFVSLIGCILPRTRAHVRALRAAPSRVPRRLDRFPVHATHTTTASPEEVTRAVRGVLGRRFRVAQTLDGISAERGYLRETGNIVFHLSLVGVLVALGAGQMLSYRGQAVVVEGRSFANAVVDYDSFTPGTLVDTDDLEPFTVTLDELTSEFTLDAQARDFAADVTITQPDGEVRTDTIRVNYPINAAGANVYLAGNGYAPHLTVRDAEGEVAFSQPVPFLPEDDFYTSRGVVKVPDVSPGLEQLGFTGYLLPSAVVDEAGARSVHPQPNAPLVILDVYTGDLGLDDGVPQNVYELDTEGMTPVAVGEETAKVLLEPGQSVELPDGLGTITFDSLPRFAALDLRYDPSLTVLLVSALLAMAGLSASLFAPRRRLWVKISEGDAGRTVVEAAALARGDDPGLEPELERVMTAVRAVAPTSQEDT
ncbi:cytochrome c biogenesis protein ResB [Georgenia satyanarayanai]|uniref:cytochrome c biogenesis protein ResB n=1 Tax=Georgenia satyanarayanai TaxID=860221 RepID=UPI00203F9EA5|nr:cytochrome c biogenesis protein ResB [Georgenia satyanarayanai]MCM3660206.1 cytochrome c biogenesis protein ResB [Georgenia satyanarayanai]